MEFGGKERKGEEMRSGMPTMNHRHTTVHHVHMPRADAVPSKIRFLFHSQAHTSLYLQPHQPMLSLSFLFHILCIRKRRDVVGNTSAALVASGEMQWEMQWEMEKGEQVGEEIDGAITRCR